MDLTVMNELIGALGFPIAMCAALFWLNRETVKHYERVLMEFRKTIEYNTEAINQLNNAIRER